MRSLRAHLVLGFHMTDDEFDGTLALDGQHDSNSWMTPRSMRPSKVIMMASRRLCQSAAVVLQIFAVTRAVTGSAAPHDEVKFVLSIA